MIREKEDIKRLLENNFLIQNYASSDGQSAHRVRWHIAEKMEKLGLGIVVIEEVEKYDEFIDNLETELKSLQGELVQAKEIAKKLEETVEKQKVAAKKKKATKKKPVKKAAKKKFTFPGESSEDE